MTKILILVSLLFSLSSYGQKIEQISISGISEAIGLPFTNYSPIHPGLEFSSTIKKVDRPRSNRYLNAKAGFFYHQKLEAAIYLGGEFQYSYKIINQKLSVDLPLGLGYLHSFYPGELYEQNEIGDFEVVNQFGRSHLYLNLGLGLTYLHDGRVEPFIRQELLIETPFANGLPLIPHSLVKIGVQIKL